MAEEMALTAAAVDMFLCDHLTELLVCKPRQHQAAV